MAQGICRGCGGPGLVSLSGFCGPMCEDAGPSYVLSESMSCYTCGGFVEPTGRCPDCDLEDAGVVEG